MSNQQADKTAILNKILPNIPSIATAKNMTELEEEEEKMGVKLETLLEREKDKEYKAVDSVTGNVYIVYNPITWTYTDDNGKHTYYRKPSRLIYTEEEAKKAAKETNAIDFNSSTSSWGK